MHIYDYIIIGSGLTGLSVAKKISQETKNILILESQDSVGGSNRPASLNKYKIENGLRFFPHTESANKSLLFLNSLLSTQVFAEKRQNTVETFEGGAFKEFVGFGDKSPEFYDQIAYFLSTEEMVLSAKPSEWIFSLEQDLSDFIQKKSVVTRFGFEGLDTEKPLLTHVIINGSKAIYGKNFVFAAEPKDLRLLLPDDVFNARLKAKLKKSTAWQAVCLDYFHDSVCTKNNLFLLNGTTDDEIGPCIGRFDSSKEGGQVSQWVSFIESEAAEDTENIALTIKKMKRQIKRAFPAISDSIKAERIFVSPPLSTADLKLSANASFPKVENLKIASSQVSAYPNLLGSLMQAQFILSAMGFGTDYLPNEISPSSTEETAPSVF